MTLLWTIFAAVIVTVVWYRLLPKRELCLGVLLWIYWGASLMWLVDAVFAYIEQGAKYFLPSIEQMVNDAFLGLSSVALGLVIWVVILLIKDPKGVLHKHKKEENEN